MADYDSSLPVRTEADGDVKAIIVDPNTTTQQLAITDDGRAKVDVEDADGDELAINGDGSINVNVVDSVVGDEKHLYGTQASAAPNTPYSVVDTLVSADHTFMIKAIQFACSGKAKMELKTGTDSSETTKAVSFLSTASGFSEIVFPQPIEVVAGDSILLILTNKDNQNADIYGFVNGVEVAV